MMKPKIVQGRTYRLSQRQQADATPEPAAQKPRQAAPCGDLVPDVPTHQNGCRACLSKAGAYLPPAVRELITDSMWSATGAQRMAAIAAWKRQEGDRLLAMLDRAAPSGHRRSTRRSGRARCVGSSWHIRFSALSGSFRITMTRLPVGPANGGPQARVADMRSSADRRAWTTSA